MLPVSWRLEMTVEVTKLREIPDEEQGKSSK